MKKDSNKVSFDLCARCAVNLEMQANALEKAHEQENTFLLTLANSVAAAKGHVNSCVIVKKVTDIHIVSLLSDVREVVVKLETVGETYEECHKDTCWKKDVMDTGDIKAVLAKANETLTTLDPKQMSKALADADKAGDWPEKILSVVLNF